MSLFGGAAAPSLFGSQQLSTTTSGSPFGAKPASSGLFGGASQSPAPSGGLFGATSQPQTQTQTQTTGIFGASQPQAQSQQATGLFGATSQPPAQPTTSLFGTQSQSQPSTGLFGATSQPQSQPSTGLFGASSQPQAQPSTGLFGATSQSQAQTQTSLGASLQQPQASSDVRSAYFDTLLEKSRKRAHGNAIDQLPELQLGLGDLRQRIRKFGNDADGKAQYVLAGSGVELGAAVRDLTYLDVRTKRERPAVIAEPTDVEGYLASLQTQTTLDMIADGLARSARDFDAFLEENVNMEWDAQRKRIYQHFGLKPKEVDTRQSFGAAASTGPKPGPEEGSFGRSRRSKAQSRTTRTDDAPGGSVFGRSSMARSVIGASTPIGGRHQAPFVDVERTEAKQDDRSRREKEARFAEKVQSFNAARIQQQTYPILHEFADVESQTADEFVEHIVKAYRAAIEITGEASGRKNVSEQGALKERHFVDAYLDETTSDKSSQLNKRILAGTCRHLEKQFFTDLEVLIAKNPREANLGGVPNIMSKVRSYIRLKAARKDLVPDDTDLQKLGDDYVWALIFYLLRSGHVNEAVQFVADNNVAFRAIDRNFITYISDYSKSPDRRLRRELQDRIRNEYTQRVRIAPENSIDPFRMACYNVIGRCDMQKKALDGLYHQMEDWLWLQFVLARETERVDEVASEVYGLKEVQEIIQNVVTKHAPGNTGFGVFFYVQVLAGRFEQAISFLYSHQYVDAVHFATALSYYGLLRIAGPSAPESELLTFSTRGLAQINFSRMIGYYTQDFRAANVVAAVDYLALICLNRDLPGEAGQNQAQICHEALRELVLETREFAQLLGDVQRSGVRIKGAMEERIKLLGLADTGEFMRAVTVQAAAVADDNGRTTDAVLLYHLAEEYDYVISICNKALSDALAVDIGQDRMALVPAKSRPDVQNGDSQPRDTDPALSLTSCDDPETLAGIISKIYYNQTMFREKINPSSWNTMRVLSQISQAKARIEDRDYTKAISIFGQLDIIPVTAQGDSTAIRQCASKYSSLDQSISRLVPNLIIWTIRAASAVKSELQKGQYAGNGGVKNDMVVEMTSIAKDLMMYSGFLKYRLPASVNDTLARIAAE